MGASQSQKETSNLNISVKVFKDFKGLKISALEASKDFLFIGTKEGKLLRAQSILDGSPLIKHLQEITSKVDSIESIVEDDDGNIWVSGRSTKIYQYSKNLTLLNTLEGHNDDICKLFYDHYTKSLISSSEDGNVFNWDTENKSYTKMYCHESPIISFDYNSTLKTMASSCSDSLIIYFSIDQNKILTKKHNESKIWSLKIVELKKILIAGNHEGQLVFMSLPDLRELEIISAHESRIKDLSFSIKQDQLFSVSFDTTVKIWDLNSKKVIKKIKDHEDWVRIIKSTSDGKRFYSVGDDDFITIIDLDQKCSSLIITLMKYLSYFLYICPCYWIILCFLWIFSYLFTYLKSLKLPEKLRLIPRYFLKKPDHRSV